MSPKPSPPKTSIYSESQRSTVLVVSMCRFCEAVALGILIPILPIFLQELDTPHLRHLREALLSFGPLLPIPHDPSLPVLSATQQTALLFSITGFAMAGIQVFAARISDHFDIRKPLIVIGMLGGTLCSASLAVLTTYSELLTARVLQGLCLGLTFPPLMAIIAHSSPQGAGGRTLGFYTTTRLLGFASGPLLGGFIGESWGYSSAFVCSAGLLLLSTIAVALWVPDSKQRAPVDTAQPPQRTPVPFDLRILATAIFLMMVGISGIISLFPYYGSEFGASARDLGFVFSAFITTRFLLQYPLGRLGDRWSKKKLLLIALVFAIPTVALQGYVSSMNELLILRMALGAVAAAVSSCVTGIAADRSLPGNRARVMGNNTIAFSLGVAIGPLLSGFSSQPQQAFIVPAVGIALLIGLVAIFVKDSLPCKSPPAEHDPTENEPTVA